MKKLSKVAAVALGVVIVGVFSIHSAKAQGTNNPIFDALNAIQTALVTLQSSVDSLVPPAETNMKFTPPFNVAATDLLSCVVRNVTGTSQSVQIQAVAGPNTMQQFVIIQPFASVAVFVRNESAGLGTGLCTFTVTSGTRSDIRAAGMTSTTALSAE